MSLHGNDSMQLGLNHLKALNIKVLAVDFDLTIVDTHTGGRWQESSSALARHVRPIFRTLLPTAHASGMLIAIVTFSKQVDLIREVLLQSLEGNEFVEFMPIEGGISRDFLTVGKKMHISRATKKLQRTNPTLKLSRSSILLIDDDLNNIALAKQQGYKSIPFDPQDPDDILHQISNLS